MNKKLLFAVVCLLAVALVVVIRNCKTGDTVSPGVVRSGVAERAPVPVVLVSNALPRLPAPKLKPRPVVPAGVEAKAPEIPASAGRPAELPRELLDKYLAGKQRSAARLLAVSRITKDLSLLDEAKKKFPGEPQVLLDWVLRAAATPEEKKQALDDFRKAAPDNAIGDYLFALQQFEAGDMDGAVQALCQASLKPVAEPYLWDAVRDSEEAYIGVSGVRSRYSAIQACAHG